MGTVPLCQKQRFQLRDNSWNRFCLFAYILRRCYMLLLILWTDGPHGLTVGAVVVVRVAIVRIAAEAELPRLVRV